MIDDGKNDDEDDGKDEAMPDAGKAKDDKTASSDDNDDDDYLPPRHVYHHGAVSGLSIGTLSPVEAFSRRVLEGRPKEIAWWLPVFGVHDAQRPSETPFSNRGDSGACVFDVFGRIVSMLDGGLTADKLGRLFHAHPGVRRSRTEQPAPLPAAKKTPPQSPVPEPFLDWMGMSGIEAGKMAVDITFTTPIEWVLQDIEACTECKATIV